jgi:hypothetical protein
MASVLRTVAARIATTGVTALEGTGQRTGENRKNAGARSLCSVPSRLRNAAPWKRRKTREYEESGALPPRLESVIRRKFPIPSAVARVETENVEDH